MFIEIGPHPVLLGMGRQCISNETGLWLPTLRRGRSDWQQSLESLAEAYVHGVAVDWSGFDRDYDRRKLELPVYPFQRKRYWFAEDPSTTETVKKTPPPDVKTDFLDQVYEIAWQSKMLDEYGETFSQTREKNWLIFADAKNVAASLSERIKKSGRNCEMVYAGDGFRQLDNGRFTINPSSGEDFRQLFEVRADTQKSKNTDIIFLWPMDARYTVDGLSTSVLQKEQKFLCGSLLNLLQALDAAALINSTTLWIVTHNAQATGITENPNVVQSPLWGLGRTLMLEHPGLLKRLIDLDTDEPADASHTLFDELNADVDDPQIRYTSGERRVARLKRAKIESFGDGLTLESQGTYLVTGGLGALGFRVARWLVAQGARHLCLTGRSNPTDTVLNSISHLEKSGCKIAFKRCDVSRHDEVKELIDEIQGTMPTLKGVVHAAGVLDDGILLNQSWQRFEKVMAPKISGAWNLHSATLGIDLKYFVLFSSIAGVFGAPGQGNYSAANSFLEALAGYRRNIGLPGVSVAWGPWSDAGMAADRGPVRKQQLQEHGFGMLSPDEGLDILGRIMNYSVPSVAVFRAEWPAFLSQYSSKTLPPFFLEISKETLTESTGESSEEELAKWKKIKSDGRLSFLENYLRERISEIIGLAPDTISAVSQFTELGIDSLMVMEIVNFIRRDFNLSLYVREVFERPSVRGLAAYLDTQLMKAIVSESVSPSSGETTTSVLRLNKAPEKDHSLLQGKLKEPMVFLLSSPRSGSTLLRVMLAGHSQLFCPPELHLLPFNSLGERRDLLGQSYLSEGLEHAIMELNSLTAEESRARIEEMIRNDATIQQVYRQLQESAAPRLLIDKSPTYAFDLETLEWAEHLFEQPKYIHLVRHPYSVIESFVRNRMERLTGIDARDPSQLAEQIWCDTNVNIIDFFNGIDSSRHHLVYYEELVRKPAQVLRNLCSFLEVPFEDALLKPYDGNRMTGGIHASSVGIGDPNFMNHNSIDPSLADSWKKVSIGRRHGGFIRRVAGELNYELPKELSATKEKTEPPMQPSNTPVLKPVSRDTEMPLSFQQERLWFLMQLEPGNVAYNLPGFTFRLQGDLNEKALRKSINEIIRRHEVLRTIFKDVDGKPVQIIKPAAPIEFILVDLSTDPDGIREEKANDIIKTELKSHFDLENGPLVRAILIRLDKNEYILNMPIHHIVSDGWSFSVILHELSILYDAFCNGRQPRLPAMEIQYADFAVWQREWLQGDVFKRLINYWKGQLGDEIPTLQLPTDRPRPSVQKYVGAKEFFSLSSNITEKLKILCQKESVTLYMGLLAIFKTLLYRYSGQEDIVVGSPIANRNRTELERNWLDSL